MTPLLPPPMRASCVRLPASAPLPPDEDAAELAGDLPGSYGHQPDWRARQSEPTVRPKRRQSTGGMEKVA
jgi:hypothetical protein